MRRLVLLMSASVSLLAMGCNYADAVAQNLMWGLGGMIQSVAANQDLSGAGSWISGALINGAIYGHQ